MTGSPIGLTDKNPTNLRFYSSITWEGQVGQNEGFCVFDTDLHGIRAGCKNAVNKQKLHGLGTIRQLVSAWAPPSENDTAAYIDAVSRQMGMSADAPPGVHIDPDIAAWFQSLKIPGTDISCCGVGDCRFTSSARKCIARRVTANDGT